ncbi:hypothetical protein [Nocardia gipuzkoensis]
MVISVGGRLALVVGSECDAMPRLGFVEELAGRLSDRLCGFGDWRPEAAAAGALLSPTAAKLIAAVKAAFAAAAEQQAALLIAVIDVLAGRELATPGAGTPRLGGDPDTIDGLRARALVASAISCLDAATDSWTADDGTTLLSELLDQAMGVLVEPTA